MRAAVNGSSTAAAAETAASAASATSAASELDACGERCKAELAEAKMRRGEGSSIGDGAPVKGAAAASGAVRGVVDGISGATRAGWLSREGHSTAGASAALVATTGDVEASGGRGCCSCCCF